MGDWENAYAETELVRLAGRSIYVLRDLKTLQIDPVARGIDVVVSGHSHVPKMDAVDGVLCLNPGARVSGDSGCPSRWRRSTLRRGACNQPFTVSAILFLKADRDEASASEY